MIPRCAPYVLPSCGMCRWPATGQRLTFCCPHRCCPPATSGAHPHGAATSPRCVQQGSPRQRDPAAPRPAGTAVRTRGTQAWEAPAVARVVALRLTSSSSHSSFARNTGPRVRVTSNACRCSASGATAKEAATGSTDQRFDTHGPGGSRRHVSTGSWPSPVGQLRHAVRQLDERVGHRVHRLHQLLQPD